VRTWARGEPRRGVEAVSLLSVALATPYFKSHLEKTTSGTKNNNFFQRNVLARKEGLGNRILVLLKYSQTV